MTFLDPKPLTPGGLDAATAAKINDTGSATRGALSSVYATKASPAFTGTPTGITKAHVGLSNVDNTADVNKPISTATQTALNGKAPSVHTHSAVDIASGTLPDARLPLRLGMTSAVITDWNTVTTNGFYRSSASASANAPDTTSYWLGEVVNSGTSFVTQTVHAYNTHSAVNTQMYRRFLNGAAGSWSAWYKLQWSQNEQDARYAALAHTHNASDINAGTIADSRLPARLGTVAATIGDWNAAITNGWYMASNAANQPNGPGSVWWIGYVEAHNALWVTQTVHNFTGDSSTNTQIYRRSGNDSGGTLVWSSWYKLQPSQAEQDARYATIATAAGKAPMEAAPLEYNEDFSGRADGAFTTALTGQTYSFLGPAITNTGGFASYSNTSDGGGYASVQLDGDAVWLGGEFKFTPYTVDGGLACFFMSEEDIKVTQNAGQGLPRMSAHLCISSKEITLDVLTVKGTAVTRVFTHPFATELAADDATVHSAWVCVDRKAGVAYVIDPTGEVHSVAHASFKIPSRWVCFEPFRTTGATNKTLAKFARVQADSRDTSRPALLAPVAKLHTFKKTADVYPASYTSLTLSGTQQVIPGTLIKATVPSTGKLRATIRAFIDITTGGGAVFFNVLDASNNVIDARAAGNDPNHSGWVTLDMVITGLAAGSIFTGQFSATALSGAAATLRYGTDASLNRYGVTFTLEPAA